MATQQLLQRENLTMGLKTLRHSDAGKNSGFHADGL